MILKRINLWLLKRQVANTPVPNSDRDAIEDMWKWNRYLAINYQAERMKEKIQKFQITHQSK